MMVLQWCIDIFNVIVEVWFGYWLFNVPKYRRFEQKWVRILEYVCFIGLPGWNIIYNRMMGIRYSNGQIISLTVFFLMAAIIFTKQSVLRSLAWAGIYFGTVTLLELPGIVLSGWLTRQPYLFCTTQPIIYDYIYLIILSCTCLFVYKKWGFTIRKYKNNIITLKNATMWIAFSVAEWWVITYFLLVGHTESGRDVFIYNIISIVLILFLLISLSILVVYRRTETLRHEHEIDTVRQERLYEKIKEDYCRKSRELHDMKHRLQPIEGYLTAKLYDKALDYVKELLGDISKSQSRIHGWTGNPFIDSLLDNKANIAKKQGIEIHIHVSLLNVGLSDKDTSVLLGNLLDNAIEAASQCSSEKQIIVDIVQKGKMLMIRVRNTYLQIPKKINGKFVTTKKDINNHGWGLESVGVIVENNSGDLKVFYDEKYFEILIMFLEKQEIKDGKKY